MDDDGPEAGEDSGDLDDVPRSIEVDPACAKFMDVTGEVSSCAFW